MAQTKVDLWNMALSLAQEKANIVGPDDKSRSADLCRIWYDHARRRVLKSGYWPCATTYRRLGLLKSRGEDPLWMQQYGIPGKCFAYSEPNHLLAPQHLHDYAQFDRVYIDKNQVIATDTPRALLRYTFDQTDVTTWDEGLVIAVATYHAALMTRNINGKLGLSDRLRREASEMAVQAATEVANESDTHMEAIPDNLQARGYQGNVSQIRYFYPVINLSGVPE